MHQGHYSCKTGAIWMLAGQLTRYTQWRTTQRPISNKVEDEHKHLRLASEHHMRHMHTRTHTNTYIHHLTNTRITHIHTEGACGPPPVSILQFWVSAAHPQLETGCSHESKTLRYGSIKWNRQDVSFKTLFHRKQDPNHKYLPESHWLELGHVLILTCHWQETFEQWCSPWI